LRLIWSRQADNDRRKIIRSIWEENPEAARRMDKRFDSTANYLLRFPYLGRIGLIRGTREAIPHASHRMVYEARDAAVVILMLVHTRRRWPSTPESDT